MSGCGSTERKSVCRRIEDDDDDGSGAVRRGSRVVISSTCTDHALLQPGQVGVVVEDDGSGTPFKVLFEGKTRWYTRAELRLADGDGAKPQTESRMCPSGHELESFVYRTDGHRCDLCRASISSGERGRRCQSCDYDLCPRCSRRLFDDGGQTPILSSEESASAPLSVGDRVQRGKDWKWEDQDENGSGTVVEGVDADGWVTVEWDHGSVNKYMPVLFHFIVLCFSSCTLVLVVLVVHFDIRDCCRYRYSVKAGGFDVSIQDDE